MASAARPADADEIRRRMAQIRRELHEDMQGVVAGAEAASDPRRYVHRYPWLFVVLAVLLGYLLVPRRRRSVTEVAEQVAERTRAEIEAVAQTIPSANGRSTSRAPQGRSLAGRLLRAATGGSTARDTGQRQAGVTGMLFGLVTPIALRAVQSYAAHRVEQWLAQQQLHAQAPGLGPFGSGPGRRTGAAGPRPGPGSATHAPGWPHGGPTPTQPPPPPYPDLGRRSWPPPGS